MAEYMAQRIIDGAYTYQYIIDRKPFLKDGMDVYLTAHKKQDLIIN